MHPLDDPATYRRHDPQGMIRLVGRFPDMGQDAWHIATLLRLPPPGEYAAVAVLGLGGSGVGGDLLAALLRSTCPLPIVVIKDAAAPGFIGPKTLVCACSYSGNTGETIAAYAAAKESGAPAVVITSGGILESVAAARGDPLVRIPAGLPPRAALPYLFLPLVNVVRRVVEGDVPAEEWGEARQVLRALVAECGPESPAERNPAKQLADHLRGRLPAIYASSAGLGAAAYRWKCQCNENGKVLALWGAFPELAHNEIVGWVDLTAPVQPAVVLLRAPDEDAETAKRVSAARGAAFGAATVHEVVARGTAPLAHLLSLVLFGDFVSVYLALVRGVDPFPVPPIDEVKRRLRGENRGE